MVGISWIRLQHIKNWLMLKNCNKTDGIYAVLIDDNILIKRLQFELDGTIKIISDNIKYEPKIYNPRETQVFFKSFRNKNFDYTKTN